ncbi:zinc-binding dehydrogenase [Marinibaculum pumilum]|uniref:Zinc-binding dehydrogenase n=1 Tax=Marinibaculum pumilum TaxID=1766165 RepID=A0ABV7L7D7_9PROT
MQAQIIRGFGGPERFEAAALPDPVPGPGQVLVRQAASSVNPVDTKLRANGGPMAPDLPAVLGCDVAGVVEALGPGVTGLAAGDAVFGCGGGVRGQGGAYAERIAVDARFLARMPAGMGFAEAAALPLVTITAWEGLFDRAGVAAGDTVLVQGGAGGVGHVVIQLAAHRGARVFATVSGPEKAEIVRRLGAEEAIFYRDEPVADYVGRLTGGRGFDLVFDATGGRDLPSSFAAARLYGQVVAIVSRFDADLALMQSRSLSLHVIFMLLPMLHKIGGDSHGRIMAAAARLAEDGHLKPLLDPLRFPLERLADAHRHLESGRAVGKVVVEIDPSIPR